VQGKFTKGDKENAAFKKDMERKFSLMDGDLKEMIEQRIAQVGLDLEVPLMENDEGNWDDFKHLDNKLGAHYNVDKFYSTRIKKPLTFEEIEAMDVSKDPEPSELGRVHFKYFFKQKMAEIEKVADKNTKSVSQKLEAMLAEL